MLIFELFSGTERLSDTFRCAGHEAVSIELDKRFEPTVRADILDLDISEVCDAYGCPDVIWASPPCTTYSVASIGHHRRKNRETGECEAISEEGRIGDALLIKTLDIIREVQPKVWFIENPRAAMRTMLCMKDLPRYTVTYCQYGYQIMKPTDIWTNHPAPKFRPPCRNGDPCHQPTPRHQIKTGLQSVPRGRSGPHSLSNYAITYWRYAKR